ncbi:MAG: DUF2283 domain-containing protein [Bacteroidales bacterium]|nr:DUF2283 domain-containing protein [Bacteroidales bacterium]
MKIRYDIETDMVYIRFSELPVAESDQESIMSTNSVPMAIGIGTQMTAQMDTDNQFPTMVLDYKELGNGFAHLHTVSYQKILGGEGFGLEDARGSIEIVHEIRNQ